MKRKSKKLLYLILMGCLFLIGKPEMVSAEVVEVYGTYGDNLSWTYGDGVLTISGTGDMQSMEGMDYTYIPWIDCNITSVVIEEGITSICPYAFYGCSFTSVKIPDSVTCIGDYAFARCIYLTDIKIPENVTTIGNSAFYWCIGLENIEFTEGIISIGELAFYDCYNITDVEMPKSLTSVASDAFESCSNIKMKVHPDSYMQTYAAENSIRFVIMGDAAGDCGDNMTWICKDGVLTISGTGEMYDWNPLDMTEPSYSPWHTYMVTSVVIESGVTHIGDYAFYDCFELVDAEISNTVTNMGVSAFENCSGLTDIVIPDGITSISDSLFAGCEELTTINIPEKVTSIGDRAFEDCWELLNVELPEGLMSIGEYAFYQCSISDIEIPKGVTSISDYTFFGCTGLKDIEIPEGVTDIGNYAFARCHELTNVDLPDSLVNMGEYAFWNAGLVHIKIPNGITSISRMVFRDCHDLTSVDFSENLTSIGLSAFEFCSKLSSIEIPDGVTNIGHGVFSWCEDLTSVKIPKSVVSIGLDVFWQCQNLTISGYADSYAQVYAVENAIPFTVIPEMNFSDVLSEDWYYDAIYYNFLEGLMTGKSATIFAPDVLLSRAEFASVLYSANNEPDVTYAAKFPDVSENEWYADAVIWANKAGVINGYKDGSFGPYDVVAREQIAVMMYNYAIAKGYNTIQRDDLSAFYDGTEVSDYAKEAMQWAVGAGVITGKEGGIRLDAYGSANRAECAAIMQRFMTNCAS